MAPAASVVAESVIDLLRLFLVMMAGWVLITMVGTLVTARIERLEDEH
jgi:hypothetical protein